MGSSGDFEVRFERRLSQPPSRVWDSLVDPDQQALWVPGVRFEARVGAPVLFDFGDEGRAEGEVLAVDPPQMLEHTWLWPGEPSSTVRWQLDAVDGGTLLVLLHRPLRSEPAVDYCTGWHVMLDALDAYVDGRDPHASVPDFAGLYEQYAAQSPAG
jgi:uncharacterized protein YndB with AHSA1/START domain